MENLRRKHTPSFKAKVALEAEDIGGAGQSISGSSWPDSELESGCPEGAVGSVQRQAKGKRTGQRDTDCRALPPDRSAEG